MNSNNMINSILIKNKFKKSKFFLINYNLLFGINNKSSIINDYDLIPAIIEKGFFYFNRVINSIHALAL